MPRQYNIPGVGYINETTSYEYLIPSSVYINETQGVLALTVTTSDNINNYSDALRLLFSYLPHLTDQLTILDAITTFSQWFLRFGDALNILDDIELPSQSRYADAVSVELLSEYNLDAILRIRRYLGDTQGLTPTIPDGSASSDSEVELELGYSYDSTAISRIRRYLGDLSTE